MNKGTTSADFAGDGDFSSVDMLIMTIGGGKRRKVIAGLGSFTNTYTMLIYLGRRAGERRGR
jgi:hypothetical protein